jgi:cytidine deaminase
MSSVYVRLGTPAEQGFALYQIDLDRPIDPEERRLRFMGNVEAFYWQAERSRPRARSWRGYRVGCSAYAYRGDFPIDRRFHASPGINSKTAEKGRNVCAETVAIDSAAALGYEEIVGMVIIAEAQEEDDGTTPKTRRPCALCRDFMRNSPLIKPETVIITALPPPHEEAEWKKITHEIRTFRELCLLYGEELP